MVSSTQRNSERASHDDCHSCTLQVAKVQHTIGRHQESFPMGWTPPTRPHSLHFTTLPTPLDHTFSWTRHPSQVQYWPEDVVLCAVAEWVGLVCTIILLSGYWIEPVMARAVWRYRVRAPTSAVTCRSTCTVVTIMTWCPVTLPCDWCITSTWPVNRCILYISLFYPTQFWASKSRRDL